MLNGTIIIHLSCLFNREHAGSLVRRESVNLANLNIKKLKL